MALQYQLRDIQRLSHYERAEFRHQRGITTAISAEAFLSLINSPGATTLATRDLWLARVSPDLAAAKSVTEILGYNSEQLAELALALTLEHSSNLLLRVLRILRFKDQLIYDYSFQFPTGAIALTELICGQLNQTNWADSSRQCNAISGRIASNLVRVAATRIFGQPTRSLLEPIVNSLDAYRNKAGLVGSTGKFGLGFYSLLYWLVARGDFVNDQSIRPSLTLVSTYLDFTGQLVSWQGLIAETRVDDHKELTLQLQPGLPQGYPEPSQPGLKLELSLPYLVANHSTIPANLNQQFDAYQAWLDLATALATVTDATISLGLKYVTEGQASPDLDLVTTAGVESSSNVITVALTDLALTVAGSNSVRIQNYTVVDQATGISLTNLAYLLVPSLSSKTISGQLQYSPVVGAQTGFQMAISGFRLHLVVGQILVKTVEFGQELADSLIELVYHHDHPPGCRIVLQLSSSAQLPVARDDVILNPWVRAELELNLLALLDQALRLNPRYYVNLLLMAVAKYTTASYFKPNLLQALADGAILAVPAQYYPYYVALSQGLTPIPLLYGDEATLAVTTEELFLAEVPGDNNIFLGRQVYFLDPPPAQRVTPPEIAAILEPLATVTTAKSTRLLFLPSHTVLSPDRVADLALLYQSQGLIPLGLNWLSQNSKRSYITNLAKVFLDPTINSVVVNILTGLSGLRVSYRFEVDELLATFTANYQTWQGLLQPALTAVLSHYVKYLSLLQPDYAYGTNQAQLDIATDTYVPAEDLIQDRAKFTQYYLDYLSLTVERLAELGYLVIGAAVSFEDFQIGQYYHLTNTVIEYLYLTLVRERLDPQRLLTPAEFTALLKYWRGQLGSPDKIEELLNVFALHHSAAPLVQASQAFLRVYRNVTELDRTTGDRLAALTLCDQPTYRYRLSGLIEAAFTTSSDFYTISQGLPERPGQLPIQILEIAINEGTTKEPLQAMIIETVQNSLDAAKSQYLAGPASPGDPGLQIWLQQFSQQISYQISDSIGIPEQGLLSLSIPFLSTKAVNGADTAAGEMGSGFFNVYRRADLVNIVTVRDGRETILIDRPIRSESSRVLDVARKMSVRATTKSNGTTITVYVTSNAASEEITQMLVTCQTLVLAAAGSVVLNGNTITLARQQYYQGSNITASTTDLVIESVVLTKGAPYSSLSQFLDQEPFQPLKKYCSRYISTNLIIDLVRGYTPTQSRTNVLIADQDSLILDLQSALFYYILQLQLKQTKTNHLRNFTTVVAVDQVLPPRLPMATRTRTTVIESTQPSQAMQLVNLIQRFEQSRSQSQVQIFQDLDQFLWNLVPAGLALDQHDQHDQQTNLSQLVHQYLSQLRAGLKSSQILASAQANGNDHNILMTRVALAWLKNKDLARSDQAELLATTQLNSANQALLNFATRFVQAYWARLPTNWRTQGPPQVKLAISDSSLGEYWPAEHTIVLIADLVAPPAVVSYDGLLDYLQGHGAEVFGKRNPAATLIHELEHAWRSTGHSQVSSGLINPADSSHGNITLSLNGMTKDYTFDQAANAMYDHVLAEGLLKDLVG